MRLLNVKTRQLQEFFGDNIPPYAILSHTWGSGEVTFQDLQHWSHKRKRGYAKIKQTCRLAAKDRLNWIWIDTCCIDKSSSVELSEAINSMFEWYREADVCYIFLEDVPSPKSGKNVEEAFRKARWLTRGWTLQEFLAPNNIKLFNSSWEKILPIHFPFIRNYAPELPPYFHELRVNPIPGFEKSLLRYFTGIDHGNWSLADVPTILSWAANRRTSRREDMAYCLLGLLNVKMPLLYGEGSDAFPRLLEEVIKKSNSHGVLAAWYGVPCPFLSSIGRLLPESPRAYGGFTKEFKGTPVPGKPKSLHFPLTNAGLSIELPLVVIDDQLKVVLGLLNYQDESNPNPQIAMVLIQQSNNPNNQMYYRAYPPVMVPVDFYQYSYRENVYYQRSDTFPTRYLIPTLRLVHKSLLDIRYELCSLYPPRLAEGCSIGNEVHFDTGFRGPLIILYTTNNCTPNIALYIPKSRGRQSTNALVALTDKVSVIEFLLKDEGNAEHPRSTWSTKIDIDKVETWACWSKNVRIDIQESPRGPKKRVRVSAIHHEFKCSPAEPRIIEMIVKSYRSFY